jgi:hypothetical protein
MVMTQEQNEQGLGLDRRTLIKRGAAASAVAWSAPLVLSSPANAQEADACTPKCYPEAASIQGRAWDICPGEPITIDGVTYPVPDPLPAPIPNSANKAALIQVFAEGSVTCPCSPDANPQVLILSLPSEWSKDASAATNFYAADASGLFGNGFFYFGTNGAVPNGVYTPELPGCYSLGPCLDQSGDRIWLVCSARPQFSYTPAGACGEVGEILFTNDPNAVCVPSCNTAPFNTDLCPAYPTPL